MKKLQNLGTIIKKVEQKTINGGLIPDDGNCRFNYPGNTGESCVHHSDCSDPEALCHTFIGCCNTYI